MYIVDLESWTPKSKRPEQNPILTVDRRISILLCRLLITNELCICTLLSEVFAHVGTLVS